MIKEEIICDICGKNYDTDKGVLLFQNKSYDLCDNCINQIKLYLEAMKKEDK